MLQLIPKSQVGWESRFINRVSNYNILWWSSSTKFHIKQIIEHLTFLRGKFSFCVVIRSINRCTRRILGSYKFYRLFLGYWSVSIYVSGVSSETLFRVLLIIIFPLLFLLIKTSHKLKNPPLCVLLNLIISKKFPHAEIKNLTLVQ